MRVPGGIMREVVGLSAEKLLKIFGHIKKKCYFCIRFA